MHENINHPLIEKPSERSFGKVFSIVFLGFALFPLFNSKDLNVWALAISTIFMLLAYIAPKTLVILNLLWFKFGLLMGSIVSKIILTLIYFFTVLPIGIVIRLFGKDLLKLRLDKKVNSYWIKRTDSMGPMKNQF
tara:strand:+ start:483 stop:887 length:405 start_codon:yes stop_codon:yes gene_type:complete